MYISKESRERHVRLGLCMNQIWNGRASFPCSRKRAEGSTQCKVCNAAQARGEKRRAESNRKWAEDTARRRRQTGGNERAFRLVRELAELEEHHIAQAAARIMHEAEEIVDLWNNKGDDREESR